MDVLQVLGISLESWLDNILKELCNLLRSTTNESIGIDNAVESVGDGGEERISLDALHKSKEKNSTYLQKIKRRAFLHVHASGLNGVLTNGIVERPSVASSLDALHEDVLGGHEWQLLLDVSLDDLLMNPPRNSTYLGPDNKTGSDVLDNSEDDIRREESLR